ncbi:phosphatidylethanolamine-binding protein [Nostoc piscinale CENA21]|uniref:Phosphatidylethanolamine-binding protein n=1 Tax=Nostoc piscinale CENA21 TaxID=224013 RepID=A0A0M4SI86_9NOSO|nr:YbhB/YbcL family Raf kinase inhibitor-like protein [Nostoc piscinale]ALF52098.1 phosphatidylethanolamine-binding protein [Nostoc piscinale CENA21]
MIQGRFSRGYSIAIVGLLGLTMISCSHPSNNKIVASDRNQSHQEVKSMKLASTAFNANAFIPAKYTCDGNDISPPLAWEDVPKDTQSIALIVDDPDAPGGTFVHWVFYDLPATVSQLTEKITSQNLPGIQGKNDFGKLGYGGPCPPNGTHRYFFKLYALDKKLGLAPGATKEQVLTAMKGHVLAEAELIGKYSRE